jgi:ABC-type amino acid transport substrate-binding protein
VLPIARAFSEFDACSDCCLTPANKDAEFYDYNKPGFLESKPLDVAKVFIFSAPGKPVESDLNALKGKRVGGRVGIVYGKSVEKAIPEMQRAPELLQNIKKLEAGRLDYIVEFEPDVLSALKTMGISSLPYNAKKPLSAHRDALVCKGNASNQKVIDKLNAAIK